MKKKEECKLKSFHNWKNNAFHLTFENGNWISTTFDWGSYSENHDKEPLPFPRYEKFQDLPSNDVEIMFDCPEKLRKKILKKYNQGNDDPIGYLNITQWIEIIKLLSAPKKPKKKSKKS